VEAIPLSKVATIFWLVATPTAASTGFVELTNGAVVSVLAPVVKVHVKLLASGKRAALSAAVVIVAVNKVLVAKIPPVGEKIAVLLVAS
jgi:hypothetical protein